jgi:DNA modification methylase
MAVFSFTDGFCCLEKDRMRNPVVDVRRVDSLVPYARNARTHDDAQIAQIAASIKEFGWTNPILVDGDNSIIAGHGRLLAARKLGMEQVPCIELAGLTETQRKAYILADNKLAMNAGWDEDMLRLELGELAAMDFDTLLTGFSDEEMLGLNTGSAEGLTDEDEVSEPPVDPVTRLGDVWVLGKHRIVCGDSTHADTVAKCLNGVKPHLMVTDPPYGVEYDANWRNEAMRSDGTPIAGRAVGKVMNDDRADWSDAWSLFPGDVAYVWHAGNMAHTVADSLVANGLNIRAQIIWNKSNMVISRGDYHPKHEPCWYAGRKGKTGHYVGGRKQTTVWDIDKPQKSETGHSTQKPVECMRRPIENNSSVGQAVYEPFSGSGTTIIAAETVGRCCHAIELNPAYVDMAVKRWQDFTGMQATLESDGRTFAECSACQ